jgi:hypothetical protein
LAELQETPARNSPPESIATGSDQLLPFQLKALPALSTATQKVEDVQETASRRFRPESIWTGPDQTLPFQLKA